MFTLLCQRIRELTLQAAELVDNNQIQQCLAILVERQSLLEQLKHQFLSSGVNPDVSNSFTSLLHWLQQQDAINEAKVIKLRDQSKQTGIAQAKIKKALHQYKNLT